jgi:hypothetical protein
MFIITIPTYSQTNIFPPSGNTGIGTTSPDNSAILEMQSTTKGMLVPRMIESQRDNISVPPNGLLIYQTSSPQGFYFFDGSSWQTLNGANTSLSNLTATEINQSLIPAPGGMDIGAPGNRWHDIIISGKLDLNGVPISNDGYGLYIGTDAPNSNGPNNTFTGYATGQVNSSGFRNSFYGALSGESNTFGSYNAFFGTNNGRFNTEGSWNAFFGDAAGNLNTTGWYNAFIGAASGLSNTTGQYNTFLGFQSGKYNTTGYYNTFVGSFAGQGSFTGNGNSCFGYLADASYSLTNATAIGYKTQVHASNTMVFGNKQVTGWGFGTQPVGKAIKVGDDFTNGNGAYLTQGGVWTDVSDRNKKEDISKMDKNEILQKIISLDITRWKYKGTADEFHIGPMADDFHHLFSVGNDSAISAMDKTGVALLAIQALANENEDLKSKNEILNTQMNELLSKVSQLEQSVSACCVNAELKESTSESKESQSTQPARLDQNNPNPFSATTTIHYFTPIGSQNVSIEIYSQDGKLLKHYNVLSGEGAVSVEAYALPEGSYLYSLGINGKMMDTKQMIISR